MSSISKSSSILHSNPPPVADNARVTSNLQTGWKLAKQFLVNKLSFIEVETEMKKIFGDAYRNEIWHWIIYINDLDPDELESQQLSLAHELDTYIQNSCNVKVVSQSLPSATAAGSAFMPSSTAVAPKDTDAGDCDEPTNFLLFRVRCFVSLFL